MLKYFEDENKGMRLDAYMDTISATNYDYTHIAKLAFLCEPELASRSEYKAMTRAIMNSISYTLYYGKRNVVFPGFGRITTSLIEHREATPWKKGRRQRWHWELKSRFNDRRTQNLGQDLKRHLNDMRRMYFIEPKNYLKEWWERFQIQLQEYWCVDVETFDQIPDPDHYYMEQEMWEHYNAIRRADFAAQRKAALDSNSVVIQGESGSKP